MSARINEAIILSSDDDLPKPTTKPTTAEVTQKYEAQLCELQKKLQDTEQKLQDTEQKLQDTEQKLKATEVELHMLQAQKNPVIGQGEEDDEDFIVSDDEAGGDNRQPLREDEQLVSEVLQQAEIMANSVSQSAPVVDEVEIKQCFEDLEEAFWKLTKAFLDPNGDSAELQELFQQCKKILELMEPGLVEAEIKAGFRMLREATSVMASRRANWQQSIPDAMQTVISCVLSHVKRHEYSLTAIYFAIQNLRNFKGWCITHLQNEMPAFSESLNEVLCILDFQGKMDPVIELLVGLATLHTEALASDADISDTVMVCDGQITEHLEVNKMHVFTREEQNQILANLRREMKAKPTITFVDDDHDEKAAAKEAEAAQKKAEKDTERKAKKAAEKAAKDQAKKDMQDAKKQAKAHEQLTELKRKRDDELAKIECFSSQPDLLKTQLEKSNKKVRKFSEQISLLETEPPLKKQRVDNATGDGAAGEGPRTGLFDYVATNDTTNVIVDLATQKELASLKKTLDECRKDQDQNMK